MMRIALILPILLLSYCWSQGPTVSDRVDYWSEYISEHIPPGTTLEEAFEKAQTIDPSSEYVEIEQKLRISLETIEGGPETMQSTASFDGKIAQKFKYIGMPNIEI